MIDVLLKTAKGTYEAMAANRSSLSRAASGRLAARPAQALLAPQFIAEAAGRHRYIAEGDNLVLGDVPDQNTVLRQGNRQGVSCPRGRVVLYQAITTKAADPVEAFTRL